MFWKTTNRKQLFQQSAIKFLKSEIKASFNNCASSFLSILLGFWNSYWKTKVYELCDQFYKFLTGFIKSIIVGIPPYWNTLVEHIFFGLHWLLSFIMGGIYFFWSGRLREFSIISQGLQGPGWTCCFHRQTQGYNSHSLLKRQSHNSLGRDVSLLEGVVVLRSTEVGCWGWETSYSLFIDL